MVGMGPGPKGERTRIFWSQTVCPGIGFDSITRELIPRGCLKQRPKLTPCMCRIEAPAQCSPICGGDRFKLLSTTCMHLLGTSGGQTASARGDDRDPL